MRKHFGFASAAILAVVVSVGVAGCGDKSTGSGGGGSSSGVVGTWTIDLDQMISVAIEMQGKMLEGAPPEAKAKMAALGKDKMAEMMKLMLKDARVSFTLNADKTAKMERSGLPGTASQTGEGTWEQSGDTVTIHPTSFDGKPPTGGDAKDMSATLVGNTLRTIPSKAGEPAMVLVRK